MSQSTMSQSMTPGGGGSGGASVPAKPPLTRAAFQAAQTRAQMIEGRSSTPLALVAVTLGFGQLYLLRWAKDHIAREYSLWFAVAMFVAYMILVGVLFVRMLRQRAAAAPRCPQCGAAMGDMSQRVALATGKCDRCGGLVIEG